MKLKSLIAVGVLAFVGLTGIGVAVSAVETVKPGYAGVVYSANGGIKQDTLKQGWHIIPPFNQVTQYPVSDEILLFSAEDTEGDPGDNSIAIGSKEGKYLKVNVQLVVKSDETRLPETFTRFKGKKFESLKNDIFKQTVKSELTKVSVAYPMFDIYSAKRGEVSEKAKEAITAKLAEIGFLVSQFEITGVVLDSDTQKAVDALQQATMEQKQVEATAKAAQAKAQAEIAVAQAEAEKAKAQAQIKVAEAQGEADAAVAKAKGAAASKVAEAEGEAKANKLLSDSLTPSLMELKKLQIKASVDKSWTEAAGKGGQVVPSTIVGSGSGTMPFMPIQIPTPNK